MSNLESILNQILDDSGWRKVGIDEVEIGGKIRLIINTPTGLEYIPEHICLSKVDEFIVYSKTEKGVSIKDIHSLYYQPRRFMNNRLTIPSFRVQKFGLYFVEIKNSKGEDVVVFRTNRRQHYNSFILTRKLEIAKKTGIFTVILREPN